MNVKEYLKQGRLLQYHFSPDQGRQGTDFPRWGCAICESPDAGGRNGRANQSAD